jgi:hypothetical protein
MKFGKFLLIVFGVLVAITAVMGVLMSQNTTIEKAIEVTFQGDKPLYYTELGSSSTDPSKLKAMVKGSIYETGEYMTVYGACFRGDGSLLPTSNASFSSWYNNGTLWHNESWMTPIMEDGAPSGRWMISMNMSSHPGTYLTQIHCYWSGQEAFAFGEWQNTDWANRISNIQQYVQQINGTTTLIYDVVNNITIQIDNQTVTIINAIDELTNLTINHYNNLTLQITNFEGDVQNNFSTVINNLYDLNVSLATESENAERQRAAIYDLAHAINPCYWKLDTSDPYYTGTPNSYDFQAVDMSSEDNVWAVDDAGNIVYFNGTENSTPGDGTGWNLDANPGFSWYGVSALEANTNYGWVVGDNGTDCYYSINTATPVELTATTAASCYDIVTYYTPSLVGAYVVATNGDILHYNGTAWNLINNTGETGYARMDMLQDNTYLFVVQGDKMSVVDVSDNSVTEYTQSGADFKDVSAVYNDYVYLVSNETPFKVYSWDGSVFNQEFVATGSLTTPEGIKAHDKFDVWVVTDTPGAYFKYDGKQWAFAEYPYSAFIGIVIGFNVSAGLDMHDIYMFNEKQGYTVGDDGLIMEYSCHWDERFDEVISQLEAQEGLCDIYDCPGLIWNLTNITLAMNASIMQEFSDLRAFLVNMNNTMVARFDTLDIFLSAFNASVDADFDTVFNLLDDLNYTINFRFDNVSAELVDIDNFLINMNYTMVSNFNDVFTRFSYIDSNLTYIQQQIIDLDNAMASNFTNIVNMITALDIAMANNFTYTNQLINTLSADMNANFTYTNSLIEALDLAIANNFTYTNNLIIDLETIMNASFDELQINLSTLMTMINDLDSAMAANFSYTNNLITTLEQNMANNFTYTNNLILNMNTTLYNAIIDNYNLLVQINDSNNFILANVTYTNLYLTTTLYPLVVNVNSTVNNIYATVLGIEVTVNETRVIVGDINTTVNTIENTTQETYDIVNHMRAWITH